MARNSSLVSGKKVKGVQDTTLITYTFFFGIGKYYFRKPHLQTNHCTKLKIGWLSGYEIAAYIIHHPLSYTIPQFVRRSH